MGSDFFEKNKRKTGLAALLLLFSGRGKYVFMFLVAAAVSVPFLVSGERLGAIFNSGPFGALLRAAGFTSMMEGSSSYPDGADMISNAAMAAATGPGSKASFWDRYLRAANAPLPPAGSPSSMGMLRGGADLAGPVEVKDKPGEKPKGAGQVKGVVNEEERKEGDDGSAVDIASMLDSASGGYGGSMGQELAMRNAPFLNRNMMGSSGGALDQGAELRTRPLDNMAQKVPVPNGPRTSASKTGKVSGFTWRNLGKKTARSRALSGMRNKKPRFQLAETVTMAGMASNSSGAEYEATYSGATYDGTEVGADLLTAGQTVVPTAPNASFAGDLLAGVDDLLEDANKCARAGGTHGASASADGSALQELLDTLDFTDPPGCCEGSARRRWNRTVRGDPNSPDPNKRLGIAGLCRRMDESSRKLNEECPSVPYEPIDCAHYDDGLYIDCDNPWDCIWEILTWFGLALLTGILPVVLVATGLFGDEARKMVTGFVRKISGYDAPEMPEEQKNQEVGRTEYKG